MEIYKQGNRDKEQHCKLESEWRCNDPEMYKFTQKNKISAHETEELELQKEIEKYRILLQTLNILPLSNWDTEQADQ